MACRIHLVQMGHGRFGRFDGLIGLAREQHVSGAQTLLVKIVGKREREVRRVLAIDQRTGDLRAKSVSSGSHIDSMTCMARWAFSTEPSDVFLAISWNSLTPAAAGPLAG